MFKQRKGASLLAYSVLIGLITVASAGVITTFGGKNESIVNKVVCNLDESIFNSEAQCNGESGSEEGNSTPVITTSYIKTANPGEAYSFALSATDEDGEALTWSWAPANGVSLPTNYTLSSSGVISGTHPTEEDYEIEFTVTDESGNTDSKIMPFYVRYEAVSLIPSTAGPSTQAGIRLELVGSNLYVGSNNNGAVTKFDINSGVEQLVMTPDYPGYTTSFGRHLDADERYVVVGDETSNEHASSGGAAYVFDATTGDQVYSLVPNDMASNIGFGTGITISNDYIIVGAYKGNGAVYIFDVNTGNQIRKITGSGGWFGYETAVSGNYLVVGAYKFGSTVGRAYLYDITTGNLIRYFTPDTASSWDHFAYDVAISDTYVAIGAFGEDDYGTDSGSGYVFDLVTGDLVNKFHASDSGTAYTFGRSVDIQSNYVVFAAMRNPVNGQNSGAAYIFDIPTGNQLNKIYPIDGSTNSYFGHDLAISGNNIAFGCHYCSTSQGAQSGSAYVFDLLTGEQRTW